MEESAHVILDEAKSVAEKVFQEQVHELGMWNHMMKMEAIIVPQHL